LLAPRRRPAAKVNMTSDIRLKTVLMLDAGPE
jgi:hypothetical protein